VQLLQRAPVTAVATAASPSAATGGAADVQRLLLDATRLILPAEPPGDENTPAASPGAGAAAAARHVAPSAAGALNCYIANWVAAATAAAQPTSRSADRCPVTGVLTSIIRAALLPRILFVCQLASRSCVADIAVGAGGPLWRPHLAVSLTQRHLARISQRQATRCSCCCQQT
jgi:hypothetical protein